MSTPTLFAFQTTQLEQEEDAIVLGNDGLLPGDNEVVDNGVQDAADEETGGYEEDPGEPDGVGRDQDEVEASEELNESDDGANVVETESDNEETPEDNLVDEEQVDLVSDADEENEEQEEEPEDELVDNENEEEFAVDEDEAEAEATDLEVYQFCCSIRC